MKKDEKDWMPLADETPGTYVERVGGWPGAHIQAIKNLQSHYELDLGEARKMFSGSLSFWEKFFLEHAVGIFSRGGSRYGALRFIQRKNINLRDGGELFSQREIKRLLDRAGNWKR